MDWFKELVERSTDENGSICLERLVKEFDKEFSKNAVSKIKYDEVLTEAKERGKKLEEFEGADIDGLREEIKALKEREKQIVKDNAIDIALIKAGAKNLKATRALIQLEGELDEAELNRQIEGLTQGEDSSFLFEEKGEFYGRRVEESGGSFEKSFEQMSYSEMCEAMKNM